MRQLKLPLMALVGGAVCGALVLNWRAQLDTQRKLDALAAAVAARPAEPVVPPAAPPGAAPRELDHAKLPPYVIEPPDVLTIEAAVRDPKTGRTERLPVQPVSGQFLVRPDGTVGMGVWGSVEVSGLTLEQAVKAVKEKIAQFQSGEIPADRLVVTVDVLGYNSKRYYVITDAAEGGEQVLAFPITGNETVLDALAQLHVTKDLPAGRSVRVVRKGPNENPSVTLPVDYAAIVQRGETATNYQLRPGDRLYVTAQK